MTSKRLYWNTEVGGLICESHLPSRGALEVDPDEIEEGDECWVCRRYKEKVEWRKTHSYPDEVCIEVWGQPGDIHLTNTNRRAFLEEMGNLWDSYIIDCEQDDGYEPGPVKLKMSIEPEAK